MICPHCSKNSDLRYYRGEGYSPGMLRTILGSKLQMLDRLAAEGAFDGGIPAVQRVPLELRYSHILADCAAIERALGL